MIQVLPPHIVDQIAAGEVVDRPAHLLKELIENSIDALSTQIEISVSDGGKSVTVSDNGIGMGEDDLRRCLLRHATSKITEVEDLWRLNSYGFRGEALACISAVSKMQISSQKKGDLEGRQLKATFGSINDLIPEKKSHGTKIVVRNLFENVPARKKFLKSDQAEIQQIRQIIKAMGLSHYKIEFKYLENGDLYSYWPESKNSLDRSKNIFNTEDLYFNEVQEGAYRVSIACGSPDLSQKTSKQMWIFAQQRWIQDKAVSAAALEAHRNLLMQGQFPTCVIWIECPPDAIDVNVHPSKSQVKFLDSQKIFKLVYRATRELLEKAPWINKVCLNDNISSGALLQNQNKFTSEPVYIQEKFNQDSFNLTQYRTKSYQPDVLKELKSDRLVEYKENFQSTGIHPLFQENESETKLKTEKSLGFWSRMQVLSQLAQTYIIAQTDNELVLIDQHAAHERIAFERLMQNWKSNRVESQQLLFPLVLDLDLEAVQCLLKNKIHLNKLGLIFDQVGPNSIELSAYPSFMKDSYLPDLINQFCTEVLEYGESFSFEKKISDIFASMACHSVIRAGQALSKFEMQEVLAQMDEFPLSSYCPHGRPVSWKITLSQLEKEFGRRV